MAHRLCLLLRICLKIWQDCATVNAVMNNRENMISTPQYTVLCSADELNIDKTFQCGQCFRWTADDRGGYSGIAYGKSLKLWTEQGEVRMDAPAEMLPFWRRYFDLDTDYARASEHFCCNDYMRSCVSFGKGIRILRQESWETLCSFIISQCNNIPRIQKIVETLCRSFGEPVPGGFAFPAAERMAVCRAEELAPLHAGYRTAYILEAARAVDSGRLDLAALQNMDCAAALEQVRTVRGVGEKVANCFILFGLHKMEAFPVDVWMRRALKAHFPENFDPASFGSYAGLAQQYIYYYARSGENQ